MKRYEKIIKRIEELKAQEHYAEHSSHNCAYSTDFYERNVMSRSYYNSSVAALCEREAIEKELHYKINGFLVASFTKDGLQQKAILPTKVLNRDFDRWVERMQEEVCGG